MEPAEQSPQISFSHSSSWVIIQGATAANLLAAMVIVRKLTPIEFGKFSTALAGLAIIIAFINPLANECSRLTAKYGGISTGIVKRISWGCLAFCLLVSVVLGFVIVSITLSQLFLFGVTTFLLVVSTLLGAILNGFNKIKLFGLFQLGGAITKLSFVLVYLNSLSLFDEGIMSYFLCYGFIACGYFFILKTRFIVEKQEFLRISKTVLAGFFLLALPYSVDQLIVQRYYTALSGPYAAITNYAKIIMLVSTPALTIGYAHILQAKDRYIVWQKLKGVTGFVAIGVIFFVFSLTLLKEHLFPLLLGSQYAEYKGFVFPALIAVGFHVISFTIFQSLLSVAYKKAMIALIFPVAAQVFLLFFYGTPDIAVLVRIYLWTFIFQAIGALYVFFKYRQELKG